MKKIVIFIICLIIPLLGYSKTDQFAKETFYLGEIESDLTVTGQEIFNTITKKLESVGFTPADTKLKCSFYYDSGYSVYVGVIGKQVPPPDDLNGYTYGYKYINGYFVSFEVQSSIKNPYSLLKLPLKISQKNKKKFTFDLSEYLFLDDDDSVIYWVYFISKDGKIELESIRFDPSDDSHLIDFNETFPFF